MDRFLILRCHPRDTIPISIRHPVLLCPTTTIQARRGPSRTRTTLQIPILPSFLFYPSPTSQITLSIPFLNSRLHIMKRPFLSPSHPHIFDANNPLPPRIPRTPPSSYAFCTYSELSVMISTAASIPSQDPPTFTLGSLVMVTAGLLAGCTGIVTQIRTNGDITLKIKQHLGWQINTCIVNASVLRLCS